MSVATGIGLQLGGQRRGQREDVVDDHVRGGACATAGRVSAVARTTAS